MSGDILIVLGAEGLLVSSGWMPLTVLQCPGWLPVTE